MTDDYTTCIGIVGALVEWKRIREEAGEDVSIGGPSMLKSCLLRRLLSGKPALPDPPPTAYSAPWYEAVEDGADIPDAMGNVWFPNVKPGQPFTPGQQVSIHQDPRWVIAHIEGEGRLLLRYERMPTRLWRLSPVASMVVSRGLQSDGSVAENYGPGFHLEMLAL